jgi:hypothetical protein
MNFLPAYQFGETIDAVAQRAGVELVHARQVIVIAGRGSLGNTMTSPAPASATSAAVTARFRSISHMTGICATATGTFMSCLSRCGH